MKELSIADASVLHSAEDLLGLMERPSPADPEVVATILERWLCIDSKPVAQGKISGIGYRSSSVFLQWLVQRVGHRGFQVLGAEDRDLARRFAEDFLSHANYQIQFYKISTGGGSIGFGMRGALARQWGNLKEQVLGSAGLRSQYLHNGANRTSR